MADRSTVVTQEHFQYLAGRTRQEDDFLKELKTAAVDAGIPAIWIAYEQASFMQILLKIAQAREVIEIGTLAGYSAITMARALPSDGRVRTIEIHPSRVAFARKWIAKSDVADRVEVYEGSAHQILPSFRTHSADAAFIDADKASYPAYLQECLRIVRPKGIIMVDNAFAFGQLFDKKPQDREVDAVRAFNDYMASQHGLHSIIVPIGDGCWVGVTP